MSAARPRLTSTDLRVALRPIDRRRRDVLLSPAAASPAIGRGGSVTCRQAANDPGERPLSDSSPTSVEEPAAAEQQHHEDDDEQSGRVHFSLPCVFGERGPASSRPLNARNERRRFVALAVRITPNSNVYANNGAGWCLFPSEHGQLQRVS